MKNVIVGTAGHVDHGKTCLIKALTGTDTDRLQEEKKRGITIENGFADMCMDGYHISIIDVPGHERFIKNMLAGIGGIDMVLFVIGLDEGVMPQTKEHLQILSMLDIKKGVVVFTKRDLVADDLEWIALVEEDARQLMQGTFLEKAPAIEVSAYEEYRIEELKQLMVSQLGDGDVRNRMPELCRLPVDRVFTMEGFGTVVTGTLIEGSVSVGSPVRLYPRGTPSRVRNLQVHGKSVETAFAGQRTAINLTGLKKEEVKRGDCLAAEGALEPSLMLDVRLQLFSDAAFEVENASRVHFYCGSAQQLAKVVLMEQDRAEPGADCYAQLMFTEPVAVKKDDRFIVRFYSPLITIGGGKVLDACPVRHKRNDPAALSAMRIKDRGTPAEVLALTVLEHSREGISEARAASKLRMSAVQMQETLAPLIAAGQIRNVGRDGLIHTDYVKQAAGVGEEILRAYHQANALSAGMAKEEFKSRMAERLRIAGGKSLEGILAYMEESGRIRFGEKTAALSDFTISWSPELAKLRDRVFGYYAQRKFEFPSIDEILALEKDKTNVRHVIEVLTAQRKLVRLDYQYCIEAQAFDWALAQVKETAEKNGSITLAQLRDAIGTSRKYAMALLSYMDEQKITRKVGEVRVLA